MWQVTFVSTRNEPFQKGFGGEFSGSSAPAYEITNYSIKKNLKDLNGLWRLATKGRNKYFNNAEDMQERIKSLENKRQTFCI